MSQLRIISLTDMSEVKLLEPFARAALYFATAILVGLPVGLAVVVLPALARAGIDASRALAVCRRWLGGAAVALMAGALALFAAQVAPLELGYTSVQEWQDFARQTTLGQMMLARAVLGLLALGALVLFRRRRVALIACVVAGLLAQVTITRTSHTAAMGEAGVLVASDFAHLVAGALWGGALLALLLAMRVRPVSTESAAVAATRMHIRRFSPLGIAGVAIAAASGLILSALHVHSPAELRSTAYGAALLVKIALVAAAVALAGLHKFVTLKRMRTSADVRGFTRSLGVEMLLVTAVFGAAALLTSTEPPPHMVTHQLADGSTHMMMMTTDPNFERSLRIAALAIVAAGAIAFALEWRARPYTQS